MNGDAGGTREEEASETREQSAPGGPAQGCMIGSNTPINCCALIQQLFAMFSPFGSSQNLRCLPLVIDNVLMLRIMRECHEMAQMGIRVPCILQPFVEMMAVAAVFRSIRKF